MAFGREDWVKTMFARCVALAVFCVLLAPHSVAFAAEPMVSEAEHLYRTYEDLNVPGNLAIPYFGGTLPAFIQRQGELLHALASLPAKEAVPVLARIADEYLQRIDKLGPGRFRGSPLMALQIPLIRALALQAKDPEIQARLDAIIKDPLVREYARGRALGALAEQRVMAIPPGEDPDGTRRRQILFDTLLGGQSLSQLLHAPARLNALADRVIEITGHNPLAASRLIGTGADTPPRRYAADYAVAVAIARKLNEGKPLDEKEQALLMDVAKRYTVTFLPEVQKEKYPSQQLGDALLHLSTHKGNEALAGLLRDYGLEPRREVEPPHPPEIVDEKAPPPETREAVTELLADAVAAIQKNEEANAARLLGKLAAPAALPMLQESLASAKTDPRTRAAILRALAHNGSEPAVYTLLSTARRTDDPKQLEPVVFALTEVRNPAAIPALLEAVFDGTSARLGDACAQVLARLPGAEKANSLLRAHRDKDFEAVPLLVALAKDWKSERGPYAGLDGLATLGMPEAVDALFDLLAEKRILDDPGRLAAVGQALSRAVGGYADTPEILAIALARLKAASSTIRLAAARALGGVDDVTVRRSLEEAAEAEKDPEVAKTIKSLLREHAKRSQPPPRPPVK